MKVKANGIEINYEIEGSGPWLTLSHSLCCDLHMWDEQMPELTKKFKVLRFDTRGHGGSSAPAGAYTLEQMADDVRGLFDSLGIKQTHWCGLSMGGMIGQTFALRHPGYFQTMILADTTSYYPPETQGPWGDRIKLAQEKGTPAQKEFGSMMVKDHTKTSTELKSLVSSGKGKATLPTALAGPPSFLVLAWRARGR